ncbi:sensor histidine kinase [Aeromicrobium camelliae]|nr:histidine kinase [Aeromicrobium camelliae]
MTRWIVRGRDAWVSVGYLLVAVAFACVPGTGIQWRAGDPARTLWVGVATAVVLAALHLCRRAAPGTATLAGAVVLAIEAVLTGTTSVGGILIQSDLLYAHVTARSTPRSQRWLPGLAAGCLALAVAGLLLADALPTAVLKVTMLLLALGVTLWWGVTVRIPLARAAHQRERADLIARAARAREREAVTAERLQISRELHDAICGHLSAIAMQSAAATARPPEAHTAGDLQERLVGIRKLSLAALEDMRIMIDVLRADDALAAALPRDWAQVDTVIAQAVAGGTPVTVTGRDLRDLAFAPDAGTGAYHVIREGLVNAGKHAPGKPVTIAVTESDEEVQLELANEYDRAGGTGTGTGYGLIGLAERVRWCGGTLTSGPEEGRWLLRARFPRVRQEERVGA